MVSIRGLTFESFSRGLDNLVNQHQTQAHILHLGNSLKGAAIQVYIRQAHHPNTEAPYYISSFKITTASGGRYRGYRLTNTDPTWLWIEFGAHPGGGQTRVLRYKPITTALQGMNRGGP